jgi:hypothetical protein
VISLQERELARRVLHFLNDEVAWHCTEVTGCECGIVPWKKDYPVSPLTGIRDLEGNIGTDKETCFGKAWAAIVESYSALGITHASDTLPALSGIARRVETVQPGRYIAGLWEKDIAYLLAWTLSGWTDNARESRAQVVGPTFSWITAPRSVGWKVSGVPSRVVCKLESVKYELVTSNPYGELSNCSIQIRSRVISGTVLNGLVLKGIRRKIRVMFPDKRTPTTINMSSRFGPPLHADSKPITPSDDRGFLITGTGGILHNLYSDNLEDRFRVYLDEYMLSNPGNNSIDDMHSNWSKEPPYYDGEDGSDWQNIKHTWQDVVCVELFHTSDHVSVGEDAHALLLQRVPDKEEMYTRIGVLHYGPVWWFDDHGHEEVVRLV